MDTNKHGPMMRYSQTRNDPMHFRTKFIFRSKELNPSIKHVQEFMLTESFLCEKLGFIGIRRLGTEAVTHLAEYSPTMHKALGFAAQYRINWVWYCLSLFL